MLKEYPAVRVKLEAIAVKRLEKHKKPLAEISKYIFFIRGCLCVIIRFITNKFFFYLVLLAILLVIKADIVFMVMEIEFS